ncbi:BspA family leucine-rich repeat surface protein [Adlercreutzia caecimuris]|uniref:BspA family leucine-rich repeat surface protein n=1 Tax=Adlercreutzia caecimuris TaxID=671266 RepID=UPI001372C5D5|nr:BspA family leucine-rich repeat surface protein [Adlercreutzia caecimuris]NBJ67609.1 BspA family leucine-rich repeat surface protein [Adlercreutzia caecimuris]
MAKTTTRLASLALAALLSIALVPAAALAGLQQAWAQEDDSLYALYYKDSRTGAYTLVIQNSTEDVSAGAYGTFEVDKTISICDSTEDGCNCSSGWIRSSEVDSSDISRVITRNTTNPGEKLPPVHSLMRWFAGAENCTSIDLGAIQLAPGAEMLRTFWNCTALKSIDLSGLDTSNVTNMTSLFQGCSSLSEVILPIDVSKVESMTSMFADCGSLTTLDLSAFNTKSLTDCNSMFSNCVQLESIDLSKFDTPFNEGSMDDFFSNCQKLKCVAVGSNGYFAGVLPVPNPRYIPGATGNWLNEQGIAYTSEFIPPLKRGTYTAEIERAQQPSTPSTPPSVEAPGKPSTNSKPSVARKTSIAKANMGVKWASLTYTSKTQKPNVVVKLSGKTLREGIDYTVSYKNNKSVGTATVTATGKGNYTGTKSVTFKIVPKGTSVKKLAKGKKSFTVTWKKPGKAALKQTTGYQVRWSLKKSMKGAKTKTVKATTKAGKKCTLKVSKLKGGKKYYVQVRTYKKTGGKTYYSSWSKAKAVKTKK